MHANSLVYDTRDDTLTSLSTCLWCDIFYSFILLPNQKDNLTEENLHTTIGLWCHPLITGESKKTESDIDHVFSVNLVRKI